MMRDDLTNWRRHVIYWVIPSAVVGLLIAFYFSGVSALASFVAPHYNRDYGALEMLQLIEIGAIIVIGIVGYRRSSTRFQRGVFALIAVLSFLVFAEEIDWGKHYYYEITGIKVWEGKGSLHNIGNTTSRIKRVVDAGVVPLFVVFPICAIWMRSPWVRYLAPPLLSIITVICSGLSSSLAHYLYNDMKLNPDGALVGNISEFREFFTYYLGLLYVYELALRRQAPAASSTPLSEPRQEIATH